MSIWKPSRGPAPHRLEVAGRILPLTVVENRRARRLILRIEPGGRALRVTVPPGIAMTEVHRFLARQQQWIETRLKGLPDRSWLEAGMKIPFRGVPHRIEHRGGRGLTEATKSDGEPVIAVHGDAAHLGRRLADFLKREARIELAARVDRHAASIGARPGRITLRDTRSRWGSCSSSGALSFSWRIMMAPPAVIDYLVAHEVAHLREMHHGPAFWRLCRQLAPRTDECRDWLKRNGASLMAIPFDGAAD